ncbi:MAG: Fe-S protein assembly co-chaperone HscB [Pseudohongiellaceae bacterium]
MLSLKQNYFQLFSLPEIYELNLATLNSVYRDLQGQVHPDRFANQNEQERLRAVQQASLLNQAFETLKSPLKRAAYLLELKGVNTHEVSQADLNPALLLEQIRLREALEDLPRDDSALEQLDAMRLEVSEQLQQDESAFAVCFQQGDLQQARQHYHGMQYLHKLLTEIQNVEEDLSGY